jgi:hypothetical protein
MSNDFTSDVRSSALQPERSPPRFAAFNQTSSPRFPHSSARIEAIDSNAMGLQGREEVSPPERRECARWFRVQRSPAWTRSPSPLPRDFLL